MNQKRILIADDEKDISLLLSQILEEEGYHVDVVSDGMEALDKILSSEQSFDLLISDLDIPRKSGKDLLEALDDSLPIIIMTGRACQERDCLKRMGAREVIAKPFEVNILMACVQSIFSQ